MKGAVLHHYNNQEEHEPEQCEQTEKEVVGISLILQCFNWIGIQWYAIDSTLNWITWHTGNKILQHIFRQKIRSGAVVSIWGLVLFVCALLSEVYFLKDIFAIQICNISK